MIKGFISEEQLDLIGLTETKHCVLSQWEMRKCWGNLTAEWMHVLAKQSSGGLILSWNQETFSLYNSFCKAKMVKCHWGNPGNTS